jgi:hypothetical protein
LSPILNEHAPYAIIEFVTSSSSLLLYPTAAELADIFAHEFLLLWVNRECGKRRKIDGVLEGRLPREGFEGKLSNFLRAAIQSKFFEEFKTEVGEVVYIPALNKTAKNGISVMDSDIGIFYYYYLFIY